MKRFSLFFFSALVFAFAPLANAKVKSVKLALDVPAGVWKATRLRDLPQDAAIKVDIKSDGTIALFLLDQANYETYPDVQRPVFQGEVSDKLSFAVKIPAPGHYYLVFDSRLVSKEVKLDIEIHAASGSDAVFLQKGLPKEKQALIEETLSKIGTELNKLFIFESFPIKAEICGKDGAFSGTNDAVLCLEFVKKIYASLASKKKTMDVLLFIIFHEVGHILLAQWGYPFYDNEEIADEFATVLFVMLGQKERLSAVTEYLIANPSSTELLAKAVRGDPHQLSVQRARNILRWLKDPERFVRWQNVFVPHMRTAVLERLQKTPSSWIDLALIEKELVTRKRSRLKHMAR